MLRHSEKLNLEYYISCIILKSSHSNIGILHKLQYITEKYMVIDIRYIHDKYH